MIQASRRSCLQGAAAAAIGTAISGMTFDPSRSQDVPTLRHGVQRGAIGALKTGLLQVEAQYGLKYDLKTFNDATAVILAIAQKELDLGNITAQHVVRAIDQGIDLSVVCGYGGGYNVLVANTDLKLEKGDLAGLKSLVLSRKSGNKVKIGTPTGSQQHLKLVYLLKQNDIDPDRDVDIVNVGFPDHVRALDGKQVDMVMTISSFASMAAVNGVGKIFYHVYGSNYGKWELGIAVRRDLVTDKPDLVQKIVGSHVGAMKLFMDDMPKRIEMEEKQSSFPPAVVEMEQRDFVQLSYKVVIDDIKRTAKEMAGLGWVQRDLSPEVDKYVDLVFLEKVTGLPKPQLTVF
jgi:NitT/TauT family transport system substrate-binding protein